MATNETNNSENGTNRKPRWKRPKEKEEFTEAEMARIKATQDVLEIIREMKEEGVFDDILKEKTSKI
ncbi:hypothetical protein BH20ACI1_BH20ACI1_03980 [soil metagenome]